MEDLFYFLCHPKGDKTKITVIDEQDSLRYEKYNYSLVNDLEFDTAEEAIAYANKLCGKYSLTYDVFESRFDSNIKRSGLYI